MSFLQLCTAINFLSEWGKRFLVVKKTNLVRLVIIILAILLTLNVLTLIGKFAYKNAPSNPDTTVEVPDNLIGTDEAGKEDEIEIIDVEEKEDTEVVNQTNNNKQFTATTNTNSSTKKATTLKLYNKQAWENQAFAANNMFPGDSETKYYRIQVSYEGKVTVHFKTDVRANYEKLAEVMKVRVRMLNTDETCYDGLMKDMPDNIIHQLNSQTSKTDELYYEITAYLDTSVGNEYQDKELVADFRWWVEEIDNLKGPNTGDSTDLFLWAGAAITSAMLCIILLVSRKKKEEVEQNG